MEDIAQTNNDLQPYEKEHIDLLRKSAGECTLFLKRNKEFPLEKPCKVLLVGCGARNTIKGGTGSGNVCSRFFTTCEQGLENAHFEIISKSWLDKYPIFKEAKKKDFIKYVKNESSKSKSMLTAVFAMGLTQEEPDYNLPLEYEADVAIYVIGRNSGEGEDRRPIKGDFLFSDTEVKDILYLNKKFQKFILVLNVGGVVDLSPVYKEVKNILLLSQLGVVTGDILSDIILGKVNPSGKLTTTWASLEGYKYLKEFGDPHDTKYLEGVYVGYRYFDSVKERPLFPFGYGLSYTEFERNKIEVSNKMDEIEIKVNVKNIGNYEGKEVIQVYVSPSQKGLSKPYQSLVAFKKTKNLLPSEDETLSIKFSLRNCATYYEDKASYILDSGIYIIRVGNSSDNTSIFSFIELKEDIVTQKLSNNCGKPDFNDLEIKLDYEDDLTNIPKITLTQEDFNLKEEEINYEERKTFLSSVNEKLSNLSNDELAKICLGDYDEWFFNKVNTIGQSSSHVCGAAGETTSKVKSIPNYLVMSDGPAGIRIEQIYKQDEKGQKFPFSKNIFIEGFRDYLPGLVFYFIDPLKKNSGKKGTLHYQYTTAIPIGTALAQSFNEKFLDMVGGIVGKEMEIFNIHLWLAPAINIHRNILCGRNFEYFSEDPLLSGKTAAFLGGGVQKYKNRGVTIKHFCCNNQEYNRNNNNSMVSERALREIYLKSFEIAIKYGKPKAIMTSYNLLNGVHTSEREDLIKNILRTEWGFNGLVMSDWMESGRTFNKISKHPAQFASNNVKAGNDLTMPGSSCDFEDILKGINKRKITRKDLLECASRVVNIVDELNQ